MKYFISIMPALAVEMKPGYRSRGPLCGPLEMLVLGLNPYRRAGCVRAGDR
jgi:hypothetical protein